nr:hypothetical protein [Tanacetum cinerariifolium]
MSLGHSSRVAEEMALSDSAFCKMYRSSYETPSSSLSLTLSVRKRGEGPGMEEEEVAPDGRQQAVLVVDTAASEPLGLEYGAVRHRALGSTEEIALVLSPSSLVVPSPIASLVATSAATILVDEDQFLEAWAGHVDIRRADMSQPRYDDHILIHDIRGTVESSRWYEIG